MRRLLRNKQAQEAHLRSFTIAASSSNVYWNYRNEMINIFRKKKQNFI